MSCNKKVVFLGDTIIGAEPLGIQRYTVEILKELDKLELPYKIEVLIPNIEQCSLKFKKIDIVRYGKKERTGFLWRHFDYSRYIKREKVISVDFTLGLTWCGSDVVCLHDCIHENFPQNFTTLKLKIRRYSYLLRAKRNVQMAKKIVTVSNTSKKELVDYYNIPEEKIVVINNAWQHINNIYMDDTILKKLGIEKGKYYFSLGSQLPHKNFMWIIQAARQNPKETFVVSGTDKISNGVNYKNIGNIIFTNYLADGEIKSLMTNCKCFIFPSLYEGFGIPPLEALACGANILISNKSCMPEIYGNSAVYFNPLQYKNINMKKYQMNDKDGTDILNKYSWTKSASILAKILKELSES